MVSRYILLLFAPLAWAAQEPAAVLAITSDAPAAIELDGNPIGRLDPGTPLRIQTTPGEHILQALPAGGAPAWRKTVMVSSAFPADVKIPLRSHMERIEIEKSGLWKDERTGLTWSAADSGSGVTVSQAHAYCGRLTTGGFQDWLLPSIEQLQTLFGGEADERGFRVIAPLKLTGWSWSSTQGNEPAENWTLDLGDGARASVAAGDAGLNRALCVRPAPPESAKSTVRR
ncbi:Lcl C-terminal domain-containing protein [Paludibaculum fermentans]|uniref:DUF1566 domain-containing protein n=1 Tax=Paludibaculum fermentans TaxID=1473598 RepID=A0A7S7NTF8_PALFE|nr:DUF1566 domain-containing protein [Paludibaculum fermentans]QOY89396.1 DUF1566 domain-containing protein [Paludibaculum fermentans]